MRFYPFGVSVLFVFVSLAIHLGNDVHARSMIAEDVWETKRCANMNPYVDEQTIILISERNSKWNIDKFCYGIRKNLKVSGAYEMSVDFSLGFKGNYPGLIFNMWDECNYDWIYKQLSIYILLLNLKKLKAVYALILLSNARCYY